MIRGAELHTVIHVNLYYDCDTCVYSSKDLELAMEIKNVWGIKKSFNWAYIESLNHKRILKPLLKFIQR